MTTGKKITYGIWITIVFALLLVFIISPTSFTPEALVKFISKYQSQILLTYVALSIVRGFFLIPSTPFILAGALLFPDEPWLVMSISMVGVLFGATIVYFMSDLLKFSDKLEKKYPKKVKAWHRRLNSPKATLIVIAWSFFPLVPTDVICYVAGIVKMPYRYMILGVFIGEAVLIYLYVMFGVGLIEYMIG